MSNALVTPLARHELRRRAAVASVLLAALLLALLPPSSAGAQPQQVAIQLLATNDFHGRIDRNPSSSVIPEGQSDAITVGGAEYLSTHLDARRAENPNTLYVDAGDLVGASPVLSSLFFDEPTVEIMDEIGLDIQTAGNHEFDRGRTEIVRRRTGGCHPSGCADPDRPFNGQSFITLGANVIDDATGQPFLPPTEIREFDGVQVGFIGVVTLDTPTVVHPSGIEGLTFLPEVQTVNAAVPMLEAQGVDVIVVLMHEGGRQDGTYNQCINPRGVGFDLIEAMDDRVDVVITGHTHEPYVCTNFDGKLVTSAYQYGAMYTEIDLTVDATTGQITSRTATNHLVTRDVEPDPAITSLLDYYNALAGPHLEEVVGSSTVPIPHGGSSTIRRGEAALGNLATDALRHQYDIDFAFQNSGGLRDALTTDLRDPDGHYLIRRRDVLAVWPFGNTVWLAEIDGTQLRAIVENGVLQVGGGRFMQVSGLRVRYHIDGTDGGFPRGVIHAVEYWNHPDFPDGTPVDLSASATYKVAMNDFMALGGDGYPRIEPQVYFRDAGLEIAIESYLRAVSPVSPSVEGRIAELDDVEVEPAEATLPGGESLQLTATALYRSGADAWRLDTERDVTDDADWSSSDDRIASVDTGLVTGHRRGSATITADYFTESGEAEVVVSETFVTLTNQLDDIVAAGGITEGMEDKIRHALQTAEEWLAMGPRKRGPALSHLDRAVHLLLWQADVIEDKNKPNQGDPVALRALAEAILAYRNSL